MASHWSRFCGGVTESQGIALDRIARDHGKGDGMDLLMELTRCSRSKVGKMDRASLRPYLDEAFVLRDQPPPAPKTRQQLLEEYIATAVGKSQDEVLGNISGLSEFAQTLTRGNKTPVARGRLVELARAELAALTGATDTLTAAVDAGIARINSEGSASVDTRGVALAQIRALMVEHGITADDLR